MQFFPEVICEESEATRGDRHFPAEGLQLQHQLRQPWHQRQHVAHLTQDVGVGPFQGRHALAQAGGEIQLAAHRTFGDFRNQLAAARQLRNLVDTFDLDRRRVHVHDQQTWGFQVRNFTERRDVQPGVMRQTRCALRQGTRKADDLVIFHTPGGDNHHRSPQFALVLGQALLVQTASVQQPAATTGVVIQRHHLIAT